MMIFVGGRGIREDKVFVLRAFGEDRKEEADELYLKLVFAYGKIPHRVDLLYGAYPSPEGFFKAEPTWAVQFPRGGDRTFQGGVGV